MSKNIKVHSALLIVTIIYGANFSIAKFALPEYVTPFAFIFIRVSASSVLFWFLSLLIRKEKIDKKDFRSLFMCAFFGAAANQLFFFKGLSLTNPINASIIMTTTPITVLIASYFLNKEKLTGQKLSGVIIGAIGAFLLITKDGISLNNDTFTGDVLIILTATFYAIYLVLVKPLMLKYHPITVMKWLFVLGSLMVIPFGADELMSIDWFEIPRIAWFSLLYVVIAATFLVYLLNTWSLQYVNSSLVGIYVYLQPVISTVIALTLRNDPLDPVTVIYAVMIMGGIYFVSKK